MQKHAQYQWSLEKCKLKLWKDNHLCPLECPLFNGHTHIHTHTHKENRKCWQGCRETGTTVYCQCTNGAATMEDRVTAPQKC
jgi:hypothetical protein